MFISFVRNAKTFFALAGKNFNFVFHNKLAHQNNWFARLRRVQLYVV